ncbi:MAG: cytochrome c [Betaproteobacteria bacterium]|nr:cytochrome c [Betaproteobacteria bacterium]MDH3437705.1 cytochrome c [Betaproteobacteria bacterium]
MSLVRAYRAGGVLALVFGVAASLVSGAHVPDVERGRALYENHCVVCHTPKVHSRPNRIPLNVSELRQIVTNWAKQENLRWSEEDIADVVWYLNETKYRY